jgi:hypothetical protein
MKLRESSYSIFTKEIDRSIFGGTIFQGWR